MSTDPAGSRCKESVGFIQGESDDFHGQETGVNHGLVFVLLKALFSARVKVLVQNMPLVTGFYITEEKPNKVRHSGRFDVPFCIFIFFTCAMSGFSSLFRCVAS